MINYIFLAHWYDGPSEVIYSGPYLWDGLKALQAHHAMSFKVQMWQDGKMKEEVHK